MPERPLARQQLQQRHLNLKPANACALINKTKEKNWLLSLLTTSFPAFPTYMMIFKSLRVSKRLFPGLLNQHFTERKKGKSLRPMPVET
jgi:hypothetical protein